LWIQPQISFIIVMVLRHLAKSTQQNNDRKFTLLLIVKAKASPSFNPVSFCWMAWCSFYYIHFYKLPKHPSEWLDCYVCLPIFYTHSINSYRFYWLLQLYIPISRFLWCFYRRKNCTIYIVFRAFAINNVEKC
jgi:hypothetical protein